MRIRNIFKYNVYSTLYFNFRMLPFKQAVKVPVVFLYKTRFIDLSGSIEITGPLKRGMISIGGYHSEMLTPLTSTIDLKGKLTFNGPVNIGCGCLLRIERKGQLILGKNIILGANSKVFCENRIQIGDYTRIGWESQIFDTNFHFLMDTATNKYFPKTKPVILGAYNWIGNRSSIMKGTSTPNYTIVSSNSLCNKDYINEINPESIIGGSPAKLIGINKIRIFNKSQELEIEKSFRINK